MKLEVGKTYISAAGGEVTIQLDDGAACLRFKGSNKHWYQSDGTSPSPVPHLIREKLSLKAEGVYRRADGVEVTIKSFPYPIYYRGDDGRTYAENGGGTLGRLDLVEELRPAPPEKLTFTVGNHYRTQGDRQVNCLAVNEDEGFAVVDAVDKHITYKVSLKYGDCIGNSPNAHIWKVVAEWQGYTYEPVGPNYHKLGPVYRLRDAKTGKILVTEDSEHGARSHLRRFAKDGVETITLDKEIEVFDRKAA